MVNKITSSTESAQNAVSKLTGITSALTAPTVSFSGSTVSSMTNGKKATEKVLSDLSKLATCVWNQAEKFPQIAQKIAHSDQQSANQFRGGGK